MDLPTALLVPAIFICVVAVVVGVLFRLTARLARHVGDVPHCANCEYSLTGLTSGRCPECGRELTARDVVIGVRPPRRTLRITGLVLLVGGLIALVPVTYLRLNYVDWYRYRSAEKVIEDAVSTDKATADRAWAELDRRRTLGQLSAEAEQKLIGTALDEHAKPRGPTRGPNWQRMVDQLGERFGSNSLTSAQAKRFLEQCYRVTLRARPIVALGDAAAYRIEETIEAPSRPAGCGGSWAVWPTCIAVLLDGEVVPGFHPGIDHRRYGDGANADRAPVSKPGLHQLVARFRIRQWRGDGSNIDPLKSDPVSDRIVELQCSFSVVDRPADEMIELVDADESSVRSVIALSSLSWRGLEILIARPPENVAFDVLIRAGREEKLLGSITLQKGEHGSFELGREENFQLLETDKVDVVLRPSPVAARGTIGITRIGRGELEFSGVKVDHAPKPDFKGGIAIPRRPRAVLPTTQRAALLQFNPTL